MIRAVSRQLGGELGEDGGNNSTMLTVICLSSNQNKSIFNPSGPMAELVGFHELEWPWGPLIIIYYQPNYAERTHYCIVSSSLCVSNKSPTHTCKQITHTHCILHYAKTVNISIYSYFAVLFSTLYPCWGLHLTDSIGFSGGDWGFLNKSHFL